MWKWRGQRLDNPKGRVTVCEGSMLSAGRSVSFVRRGEGVMCGKSRGDEEGWVLVWWMCRMKDEG